ncbi:hypothetical protein AAFC00_001046 [Neodothiora populina]|uniref:C3H1-type domain-containing protein n=1 Tax=Neodothiora populina TaxID=2781224 RepID=A0ABR3PMM4_9PEZI
MLNDAELEGLTHGVQDFHTTANNLISSYRRLRSDYEEEREAREKYKKLCQGQDRNPFVLVLVDGDGDGYVFEDALIKSGADGGVRAANLLDAVVKEKLLELGHTALDFTIMVRIYANLAGLSRTLARAGVAGNEARSIAPFVAGFNRARDLFDFVDVGEEKETADFKIREMFRLFADNPQCKRIFFAGCHDGGYHTMLTSYMGRADRISLIRGVNMRPYCFGLQLKIEDPFTVFRSSPLRDDIHTLRPAFPNIGDGSLRAAPYQPSNPQRSVNLTPLHLAAHSGSSSQPVRVAGNSSQATIDGRRDSGSNLHNTASSRTASSRTINGDHGPSPSASQHSDTSATVQVTVTETYLPRWSSEREGLIPINRDGHRLDFYKEPPSNDLFAAYNKRTQARKQCNDFQFLGFCEKGARCIYIHSHSPLEPPFKRVLESILRTSPCPAKGECRLKECYRGHICTQPGCNGSEGGKACKLKKAMHGIDTVVDSWAPAVSISTREKKPLAMRGQTSTPSSKSVSDESSPTSTVTTSSGMDRNEGSDLGEPLTENPCRERVIWREK